MRGPGRRQARRLAPLLAIPLLLFMMTATTGWAELVRMASNFPDGGYYHMGAVFDGRQGPATACSAGCAYFYGGYGREGVNGRIIRYSTSQDTYTTMEGYLGGQGRTAFAWTGSEILVMTPPVRRYDPRTGDVATLGSTFPDNRTYGMTAAYANGFVWIFGGTYNTWMQATSRILRYDPTADQFSTMGATIPGGLMDASAVDVFGSIYLFGGAHNGNWASPVVWRYDTQADTVTEVARLHPARSLAAAVYDGDHSIYLFGGKGDDAGASPIDTIDRFDTRTFAVERMADTLPVPGYGLSALHLNYGIYLFGHSSADWAPYVHRFDPEQGIITPTTEILTQTSYVTQTLVSSSIVTQLVTATKSPTNTSAVVTQREPPAILTNPVAVGIGGAALVIPLGYLLLGAITARRRARPRRNVAVLHPIEGLALQIQGLRVAHEGRSLEDVSLDVPAGSLTLLLGPSGSGKSTLLKAIVGLVPFRGHIQIAGQPLRADDPASRKTLGYVPQDLQLYTNLHVLDNLVYYGTQFGLSKEASKQAGLDVLAALGLEGLELRPLKRLSGGQQRRVSIAAALVHSPRVVILDEPTSGLDLSSRKALWTALQRLARDRHVGILASTHFIDDCQYATRVGILIGGRLVAHGNPHDLIRQMPGQGRCVEIEFDEFGPEGRKRFAALLPELKRAGLVDHADVRLHDARCFAPDPGRTARILPELLHRRGFRVRSSRLDEVNLEDVFVHHSRGRSPVP